MDKDLQKIKKLTAFMRKNGLLHLKQGDIELSLSPGAIEHPEIRSLPEDKPEPSPYSEEDMLLWSAPGVFPDEPSQ